MKVRKDNTFYYISFRMRTIKDMACLEKSSFQQINICHHQDMLGTKHVTN